MICAGCAFEYTFDGADLDFHGDPAGLHAPPWPGRCTTCGSGLLRPAAASGMQAGEASGSRGSGDPPPGGHGRLSPEQMVRRLHHLRNWYRARFRNLQLEINTIRRLIRRLREVLQEGRLREAFRLRRRIAYRLGIVRASCDETRVLCNTDPFTSN